MTKKVAVFAGNFNPPGRQHRLIAEELSRHFDHVIIVPCGPRPDKIALDDIELIHRATMVDLAFRDIEKVEVDLFDLEQTTFSRLHHLEKRYAHLGEIWHVIGSDLAQHGRSGNSVIHRIWQQGSEIWQQSNFAVFARENYCYDIEDLPAKHRIFNTKYDISSSMIREKLYKRESIDDLVPTAVGEYIKRYGLYRGRIPNRATRMRFTDPRFFVVADEHNAKAKAMADKLSQYAVAEKEANSILVIGGDGTMLHAISNHWRKRLPFLGVNAGHVGFLLNNAEDFLNGEFTPLELVARQMPLLYVETESTSGEKRSELSFNDVWIERASSQSAWIEVRLNGATKIEKLVGDGALVSTAAGSTAYARAMGAMPLLADTQALLLVGSNVMSPANWKCALISIDSTVEFNGIDTTKRPLVGFAGSIPLGDINKMAIRVSKIAAAELAFLAHYDMAAKISNMQFPQNNYLF